ncbi:gp194 [Bacillus phage G]|uniref:Gp194 n=1 Tax=Bacillus phage G TaxID=2884420 RepID=G3MBR0_9CAUD|nr:gp194 [Bacillus phage G]AEO93454.1 gp194 [Bacillus phage G]
MKKMIKKVSSRLKKMYERIAVTILDVANGLEQGTVIDMRREVSPNVIDMRKQISPNVIDMRKQISPNVIDMRNAAKPNVVKFVDMRNQLT